MFTTPHARADWITARYRVAPVGVVDHHGIRSVCVPGCVGLLVCVPWFDMVVKVSKVSNVACDALESLGFGDSTLQFPKWGMCRIGAWVVTARNSVVMAGIGVVTG